jgi:hypothetical protein
MNAPDPLGVRARFLDAFAKTTAHDDEDARRLCETCVAVLPVARAAISVNVNVEGVALEVLSASDPVVERVEWAQVTLGQGPGVDAIESGGPIIVADLGAEYGRWPMFAYEALDAGVVAMYSLPLQVGAIQVGVLDLYCDTRSDLAAIDYADCIAVADTVTGILLSERRPGLPLQSLGSLWDQSLGAREVHQATGMVVAQLEVSAREAYVRLQAYAYAHERLLSEVAEDVVHRRLKFTPELDSNPHADADPDHPAPP